MRNLDNKKVDEPIRLSFNIAQGDFIRAGEASSKIKKKLLQLGFPVGIIRRVAIATYEAEMNTVIHSLGGILEAEIAPGLVKISVEDYGPGIPDVQLAMREGFSTAPEHIREMGFGAGMGLPNMRSCSDEFVITSKINEGTRIEMIIHG